MTEDANNQDVTQAYRDLATETTPPGLDDKMLAMATRETRSRYGIARAWVRPVAWAATIGLSLAIVLEVWQVIPPGPDAEPTATREIAPSTLSADEAPARLRQEMEKREDTSQIPGPANTLMDNVPVNPGGGGAEELGARRAAPQNVQEAKESPSVVMEDADAFAAKDMRILEEAEVKAQQRAGEPEIASFAVISTEAHKAHCDETARATAESWYECIEGLREAGDTEFAENELAALALAFPDFEVPVPSR
ncbi:MAG: hypothetical protein QNI98_02640 [Woeseiaceae bacterium]|nr:hypothetical protein [Woeseiaceae bacterium]